MRTCPHVLMVLLVTASALRRQTREVLERADRDHSATAQQTARRRFAVGIKTYNVSSMEWPHKGVVVWYPTANGSYPFVSFAHGKKCGGEKLQKIVGRLCSAMAERGLIVAAHKSCNYEFGCNSKYGWKRFYEEQTKVINWAKSRAGFPFGEGVYADFSNGVGVAGHSMGGQAAMYSASHKGHQDIRAAVLLTPYSQPWEIMKMKKPFLIFSSNADKIAPFWMSKKIYDKGIGNPKGLVNQPNKSHGAPLHEWWWYARPAAAWLLKFLRPSETGSWKGDLEWLRKAPYGYGVQAQGW